MRWRRFAILEHDHPFLHWDLLLEDSTNAATWRLLQDPRSCQSVDAQLIQPHRLLYLTYEGPVSGDRGFVTAVSHGLWKATDESGLLSTNLPGQWNLELRDCSFARFASLMRHADGRESWTFAVPPDPITRETV
ncbi:MAG: hypothetical protein KDA96_10865 [Planctomycetaceae bacterium]|nr:hypothetical protein [Planctomycetaceae bacterium]